jgi:ABC-2 type transport system permease protein
MTGRSDVSAPRSAGPSIVLHALRGERVRLIVIGLICAAYAAGQVVGYRVTYPSVAERVRFAHVFSDNIALRLFYGVPHDLATVAGYAEFRVVGILAIVTAAWSVFAAVRALRGEEDAGCYELILAGAVGRGGAVMAILGALAVECVLLWLVTTVAFLLAGALPGDMTARQSALTAAALVSPAVVFATVGALASQLAPTRRSAQAAGVAAVGLAVLLRIAADVGHGVGWIRWLTPIGWAEELRPVTAPRPAVLLLFAGAAAAMAGAAVVIARRRDIGSSVLHGRAVVPSRSTLLGSPTQAALRGEVPTLLAWAVSAGLFAGLLGAFAGSVAEEIGKAHIHTYGLSIATAAGYLAVVFSLFVLLVALFAVSHVGGLRDEESSGRLETLFALPVGRRRWLAGRLVIAAAATTALALLLGVCAWAGAAVTNAGVGLTGLLAAGANCIAVSLLFLALGTLLFAWLPRPSPGAAFGLVGVAFLWELLGGLLGAPGWVDSVSPFRHVTQVPLVAADLPGTAVMLAIAVVAAVAAVNRFARRDLQTG